MSETLASSSGFHFGDGDFVVQQYWAMTNGRSYRWKVVGCLKLPTRDRAGRLRASRYRHIQSGLSQGKAFDLANSLNRLNNLPLQDPPKKRKSRS